MRLWYVRINLPGGTGILAMPLVPQELQNDLAIWNDRSAGPWPRREVEGGNDSGAWDDYATRLH